MTAIPIEAGRNTLNVPAQLSAGLPSPDRPPQPPGLCSGDETTRLLCAGSYLSARFRREVMKLLVRHDERALAPAAGVDVLAVLATARQVDRLERRTGAWTAAVWTLFALADQLLPQSAFICAKESGAGREGGSSGSDFLSVFTYPLELPYDWIEAVQNKPICEMDNSFWVINYACVCLLLWLVKGVSGRGRNVYEPSGPASRKQKGFLFSLVGPAYMLASYWAAAFAAVVRDPAHWVAVAFPLLLVMLVWAHRRTVERTLRDQFHPAAFEQRDPERLTGPAWLREVGEVIKREQDSKIVLYDLDRGFAGLGRAVLDPTPLVMDLRRKPDAVSEPLVTADVLNCVRDELEEFRQDVGPQPKIDRLKEVQVDELIYLPAGPPRNLVDHGQAATERHLREAVEEGGESRRHYLRARIGAWEQQAAVTALVRVYIQGKSLTLEVGLYSMDRLRPEFKLVDAIAERGPALPASSVVRALIAAPAAGVAAMFSIAAAASDASTSVQRRIERRTGWDTLSEGASGSVRELAAAHKESPILAADVDRYLKALMERITTGAVRALREKGYDTGSLEQQVVQVSSGGIFVGSMSGGAVATGRGAQARTAPGLRQTRIGTRRRRI